jgi:hypothetical protein
VTQPILLPSNRTPFETAIEATNAARYPLPVELITSLWSAANCPIDLLPYLAWALSVDIWDDAWPETTKREAVRKSLEMHRIKTTLAGIKAHVAMAGSEVRKAIRPPARSFLYAAMTDDARAEWLQSLPQIRLYPFVHGAFAGRRTFASGPARRYFHGVGHLQSNRGAELYGYRATLYDDGVERDIAYESPPEQGLVRLLINRVAKRSWHGSGFFKDWLQHSKAAEGVVTVQLSDDVGSFAVQAGLDPVDVRPTRVAQGRIAPAARSFFGSPKRRTFLRTTYAPNLIYDRVSLNDPTRLGARRQTRSYHGHGRFGIPPYTAELTIRVPMLRTRRRGGRWHGAGFRCAPDMTPLNKAIEAVRASKAFRDTVLINTATFGRVEFGGGLAFGDFTFGEMREIA